MCTSENVTSRRRRRRQRRIFWWITNLSLNHGKQGQARKHGFDWKIQLAFTLAPPLRYQNVPPRPPSSFSLFHVIAAAAVGDKSNPKLRQKLWI